MKRPLQIALAIALAAGSIDVLALGLGTIEVKSRLNEPLVAEIPVIQAGPGEAQGLIVQLASSEDFERVGLSRTRVNMPLEFSLHSSGERTVIRVTTKEAVREPFLDFLVEANWPNGRLLREYTVLLDPPVMAPSRSAQVKTPVPAAPASEPAPAAVRTEPAPAVVAAPAPVAAAPEPTVAQAPPPPPAPPAAATEPAPSLAATPASGQITAGGEFGPVDAGQTLSEIARLTRTDDTVSINQMMIALLRHNPDAFYQDNINALKRGAILRIPSAEEVRDTAAEQEAAQLARAHIDEWRTAAAPTLISDSAPSASPAPAAAAASPPPETGSTVRRERVALVPPRSGDEGGGAAAASRGDSEASDAQLRNELARVAEELEAERQEAAELRSRLSNLEETNTKSARMIALQNDQLAQLQAQLEQMRAASAADGSSAVTDALTDEQQLAAADSPADTDSADDAGADADEAITMADTDAPAADAAPADEGLDAAVASTESDTATEIWGSGDVADEVGDAGAQDDTIMSDTGASLADAGPETEIIALDAEADSLTDDATAPAAAQSPRPAATTPWYQRPVVLGLGALALLLAALGLRSRRNAQLEPKPRRKSVADQFSESGTDEAAPAAREEEIAALRSQLAESQSDAGLHLELASLYYSLADREAFIAAARDMHAHVDSNSDEWAAVRSMGHELAADEPLFADPDILDSDDTAFEADDEFSPDMAGATDAEADPSLDYDALLGDLQADAPLDEPVADSLVFDEPSDSVDDDFGIAPRSDDVDMAADPASSFLASMDGERDAGLDFPGTDAAGQVTEEPVMDDAGGLSFDLDDTADVTHDEGLDPLAFDTPAAEDPQDDSSVHDTAEDTMAIDPATAEALSLDDDLGSLTDLPGIDGALDSDDDPTGIKLDLAKAYLDMGDPDGAKAMLEEVLVEGNEAQQEDARALIERIG